MNISHPYFSIEPNRMIGNFFAQIVANTVFFEILLLPQQWITLSTSLGCWCWALKENLTQILYLSVLTIGSENVFWNRIGENPPQTRQCGCRCRLWWRRSSLLAETSLLLSWVVNDKSSQLCTSLNNFKRERLTQVAKQLLGHPPVPTLPEEEAN